MTEFSLEEEKPRKKRNNTDELVVQNTMRTEDGRRFLWDYLQNCGVFATIFAIDTHQHAYSAGMREAGMQLHDNLRDYAPDQYLTMIKENIDE